MLADQFALGVHSYWKITALGPLSNLMHQAPATNLVELRQLLDQSRTFPRSRNQLVKAILRKPEATIAALVGIAGEALDDEGRHIVHILERCLDQGVDANLLEQIYRLIPKKSVHFATLAAKLSEVMLALVRSVRPIDRLTESVLLHQLASHLRDIGEFNRASDYSGESVRRLKRLAQKDPTLRPALVDALGMWSKHLSEAHQPHRALRAARLTLAESLTLQGRGAGLTQAQAAVVLGSCLIEMSRHQEARPLLRAARRTLARLVRSKAQLIPDLAHALMFLACAEFNAGTLRQARQAAESAWAIILALIAENRGEHFEDFCAIADILALIVASQGDELRVRQVYAQASRVLLDLAGLYPAQFGLRCIWSMINRTSQLIHLGQYPEALKMAELALKEGKAMQRKLKIVDNEAMGTAYFNLASARFGLDQRRAARQAGFRAESLLRQLPRDNLVRDNLLTNVPELLQVAAQAPQLRIQTKVLRRAPASSRPD